MKISDAVQMYVTLRDEKAKLKADYEATAAKIVAKMDKIEAKLLEVFESTGLESVNTAAGTAYKTTQVSVTAADKDAFFKFCQENNEWSIADVRASKTGVVQYKDAHDGALPPGLNYREEVVVNVRRPT